MDSRLFEIDPYAGASYALYTSVKGDDASFEDFLLHYDSTGASEGDNSWLTNLISEDTVNAFASSDVFQALSLLGVDNLNFGSSNSSFFDSQVYALKMQLIQAFSQREDYSDMQPLLEQLLS